MRLAGLVILYQPSDSVVNNIKTYLPFVEKLHVFDNTEIPDTTIHQQIHELPNTILIHDQQNKGIANRLNNGAYRCIDEGFTWLLTMDQDSFFEKPILEKYLDCLQHLDEKNSVAMVGVEYETKPAENACNYKTVQQLITSGSIVNLNLFKEIGGFDEELFIDDVDTDYCFSAITKGYRIIQFENIFLNHSLGKVSYHTSLKTFKTTSRTLHSPLRLYYMVRNFLYISRKYPQHILTESKRRKKKDLLNRIKNNFLYGEKKVAVLKYVIKGWMDYKFKMINK